MNKMDTKSNTNNEKLLSIWQDFQKTKDKQIIFSNEKIIIEFIEKLDKGLVRSAYFEKNDWVVNHDAKIAILMYFILKPNQSFNNELNWFDKIGIKNSETNFLNIRRVPGSIIRFGAFLEKNVVVMPSFINIGAYIGENTMIDTWSTVGSCAQVGKNCHISGGVGIGGVLEPIGARPVIIEDNCFIGARSEIAEGVIVETGSVISMGVFIGSSTKIIDRDSGEIFLGKIPKYSVVVPGSYVSKNLNIGCAVIIKKVDEKTRSKTSINELLRDV